MYIEEEITLAEFSERFLNNNDFSTPGTFDCNILGIEVLTMDKKGKEKYSPIKNFIIKEPVENYYTDGVLKGTGNHRIIENGAEICLKDHPDFKKIEDSMHVVDIEVDNEHTYKANGRLNHNTTSGGKALPFHSTIRVRLKMIGQIKKQIKGEKQTVGTQVKLITMKNRIAPPYQSATFNIYFDRGIDDGESIINALATYDIVPAPSKGSTTYETRDGRKITLNSRSFPLEPELEEEIFGLLQERMEHKYRHSLVDENVAIEEAIDE